MLAMHDKMLQIMKRRETDAVYLGASSSPSGYILPNILAAFCEKQPLAKFVITQDSSQMVLNGMLSGLYELGFVGMPVKEDTLECIPFCNDKIVIAAPNSREFQKIDSSDRDAIVGMLKEKRVIMRKAGSGTRSAVSHILEQLGLEEPDLNVFAHLDDQEATKNLVESGLGIALMSEWAVRNRVDGGWMLSFDIPDVDVSRKFYVLKRKNVPLSQTAEEFFELVTEWNEEDYY